MGFREAHGEITGDSWLDDLARMSLSAAEEKFSGQRRPRGEATEAAISRLTDAHRAGFSQSLDEERELAGLPVRPCPGRAAG